MSSCVPATVVHGTFMLDNVSLHEPLTVLDHDKRR